MSPLEHWVTQFAPGACERDHSTKTPAAEVSVIRTGRGEKYARAIGAGAPSVAPLPQIALPSTRHRGVARRRCARPQLSVAFWMIFVWPLTRRPACDTPQQGWKGSPPLPRQILTPVHNPALGAVSFATRRCKQATPKTEFNGIGGERT